MVFNPSIQFYLTPIEFFGAINYLSPIKTAVICIVFCCMFNCVQQNFLGLKVYNDILFAGISEKREKMRIGNSLGVNSTALGLYILVGILMPLCLLLVIFGVYFQLDALYPVIESLFPSGDFHILKILVRCIVLYLAFIEVFRTVITFVSMSIVYPMALNNATTRITNAAQNAKRFSWKGFSLSPAVLKTIEIYKMIQIYLTVIKPLYNNELPILIFCGSVLAVVCNFGTLTLYDKVELPLYACFPCISIIVIVLVVFLVPQAQNVFENSQAYRKELKFRVKSKTERAVLRSLRAFCINCPFFKTKASIRPQMIQYQTN